VLPTELIYWPFLLHHEHLACSLVELMQITQPPPDSNGVFHHTPEAFDRVEVMSAVGRITHRGAMI
jgi:hypothetical protein